MSNPNMKVVNLPRVSLADISNQMRKMADALDRGDHGDPTACVIVLGGGAGVKVFGFGEAEGTVAHYLLCCAQRKIEVPLFMSEEDKL